MHLSNLNLNQFRCFDSLRLNLGQGITVFHGDNAQGKTSILEAVCLLMRLQSPRASSLADCIAFQDKQFTIGGELMKKEEETRLVFQYSGSSKKWVVDGESQKRSAEYLRCSGLIVWMANDDLNLVRGGGDGRRRYLDFLASQLYPTYRPAQKAYEKALRSRNFLLKRDASPKWEQISPYTKILSEQGAVITRHRAEMIDALMPFASGSQVDISRSEKEALALEYLPGSQASERTIEEELNLRREEEMKRRVTLAGPHRDDFHLFINEKPAAKFASEGQQRTLALSLKLAQARLLLEKRELPPLLLIDDVFGELDPDRRNALMAAWPDASQKLITTTHLDWLSGNFSEVRRVKVEGGTALG